MAANRRRREGADVRSVRDAGSPRGVGIIRALTLTQPWATLVAVGAKKIETRSWGTSYRGPLAIHAAKGLGPAGGKDGLWRLCGQPRFDDALTAAGHEGGRRLPFGAIIAVVQLVDVVRMVGALDPLPGYFVTDDDLAFGNFDRGRYGWVLEQAEPLLPAPFHCRGAQGLWHPPAEAFS